MNLTEEQSMAVFDLEQLLVRMDENIHWLIYYGALEVEEQHAASLEVVLPKYATAWTLMTQMVLRTTKSPMESQYMNFPNLGLYDFLLDITNDEAAIRDQMLELRLKLTGTVYYSTLSNLITYQNSTLNVLVNIMEQL